MSELEKKAVEAVVDLGKDVVGDLIRPSSQSIGKHIGTFVDGVMGWVGYLGEKQKIKQLACLELYKRSIQQKLEAIPQERLIDPPMRIAGPAIEASKYFIEENECCEMFSQLLASACDLETTTSVHPSFPMIIQQLSPTDAKFLKLFTVYSTYPVIKVKEIHSDGKITPYRHLLFDFKGTTESYKGSRELMLTEVVENLIRLGIVILNREVIELNYNYDQFISHWYYQGIQNCIDKSSKLTMLKYRVELSELGKNFVKCCIPSLHEANI